MYIFLLDYIPIPWPKPMNWRGRLSTDDNNDTPTIQGFFHLLSVWCAVPPHLAPLSSWHVVTVRFSELFFSQTSSFVFLFQCFLMHYAHHKSPTIFSYYISHSFSSTSSSSCYLAAFICFLFYWSSSIVNICSLYE